MLGAGWTEVVALVAAFVVAVLATPAVISGAVLLQPFRVSVLGTPSPSVTPTNLLYNVVSTPGALYRYWRPGQTGGRLALMLIAGTVPGVIAGSVIRLELLRSKFGDGRLSTLSDSGRCGREADGHVRLPGCRSCSAEDRLGLAKEQVRTG